MARKPQAVISHQKTLLLAIHAPYNRTPHIASYYEEFINLVRSNGVEYDDVMYIKLRDIDRSTFVTSGKLDLVKEECADQGCEKIIISEPLTGQQERNLEDVLEVEIVDRTELILEIFEKAAVTAEGKTQVEIAMLEYEKTRLAGKGVGLEQQKGVIGVRGGAGEKLKERETRLINKRIATLKRQLKKMEKTRDVQRKRRLDAQVPQICLIGYTNAGKSTLLNLLTKSNVLAQDKLFATLDTTTRELFINRKKIGVISDTVGFIQALPPKLIDAFKSTLSELQYADLLLQVVDVSDPNWQMHIKVVNQILLELDVDKQMLYVFNKIDCADLTPQEEAALEKYQPHVLISALDKQGVTPLLDFLYQWALSK